MSLELPDLSFTEAPTWRARLKLHYARVALQESLGRLVLPDGLLVRWKYLKRHGRPVNLRNPRTFTEKIQWRKLYGICPKMCRLSDKVRVRGYVEDVLGKQALIPLVGVWEHPEQIPVRDLPSGFVAKANHGCGYNLVVRDKSALEWKDVLRTMHGWLSHDYSRKMAERQYREVPRRILIEEILLDREGSLPTEFKIHCFRGADGTRPRQIVQVDRGRFSNHTRSFFDEGWARLDISLYRQPAEVSPERPDALDAILEAARALSRPFSYVRVDLYCVENRIYFGEMTFTPGSGYKSFDPPEVDLEWGAMWDLP